MDLSKAAAFDHQFPINGLISTLTVKLSIVDFMRLRFRFFTSVQTGWDMNTIQKDS